MAIPRKIKLVIRMENERGEVLSENKSVIMHFEKGSLEEISAALGTSELIFKTWVSKTLREMGS